MYAYGFHPTGDNVHVGRKKRRRHACRGLLVVLAAICVTTVHAVSSVDCMWRINNKEKVESRDRQCPARGLCGTIPQSDRKFYSRLSPRCAELFETYRSDWSKHGVSNLFSHRSKLPCDPSQMGVSGASHPMIIATNDTAPFMLCTAAKAGSTNLRKLLFLMLRHPQPPPNQAAAQNSLPHFHRYPAAVLYDLSDTVDASPDTGPSDSEQSPQSSFRRLTADQRLWQPTDVNPLLDSATDEMHEPVADESAAPAASRPPLWQLPAEVPSFTFGRNPYARLLSGFRDKLAERDSMSGGDAFTQGSVNAYLGLPRYHRFPDTPDAFQTFVRMLFERGVVNVNEHFKPATSLCHGSKDLRYDFYLRLEDMATWFPCWVDGLGLREWTETGWASTPFGSMFIGRGVEDKFVTFNKHSERAHRPVWDEAKGTASHGVRGVDWDLLSGDRCWWAPKGTTCEEYYATFTAADGSVVPGGMPKQAEALTSEGVGRPRTPHDTDSQNSWPLFYDQQTADLVFLLYRNDFEIFGYERADLAI